MSGDQPISSLEGAFTRGPWRIEGRRGPGYIISAGVNEYGDGPASYVGVLDPMFSLDSEAASLAANASIVAAAPTLAAIWTQAGGISPEEMEDAADIVEAENLYLAGQLRVAASIARAALLQALGDPK